MSSLTEAWLSVLFCSSHFSYSLSVFRNDQKVNGLALSELKVQFSFVSAAKKKEKTLTAHFQAIIRTHTGHQTLSPAPKTFEAAVQEIVAWGSPPNEEDKLTVKWANIIEDTGPASPLEKLLRGFLNKKLIKPPVCSLIYQ
jgi:hypothetical protein